MTLRIGCPIWSNRDWAGRLFSADARAADFLPQYAAVFDTVEGNNTFYGLPAAATIQRWLEQTPARFRFCFKFPRAISHDARLRHAGRETGDFLTRMAPLRARLGPLFLQLPPSFGGGALDTLLAYLDALPDDFDYAVEVRHADFYAKGAHERRFNRALAERGIDRVVLDSRALFSVDAAAADADTRGAQRKKPRVAARVVALGPRPLIRFIGHPDIAANDAFFTPWVDKLAEWIDDGREPYLFAHTPNNRYAPELCALLRERLAARLGLGPAPAWPGSGGAAAVTTAEPQRALF